ncbi:chromate efflux transporter [Sinirhodobacter sp. HNIBRBA609]|nr:chromate efflux transporter [Sinirhodobacter sp. HNIBRBA609]
MIEVFWAFLKLGLSSFGGPTAHIGYFRTEFVTRRRWLDDAAFAERLALAQFLPGPASSQLGFAIGWHRAGPGGALAAFLGFTLPSAILMAAAGLWAVQLAPEGATAGALSGLKLVALAVVAQAIWAMSRALCPDLPRRALAGLACVALLIWPVAVLQIGVIALASLFGALAPWFARPIASPAPPMYETQARPLAMILLVMCACLALAPLAHAYLSSGALVFGGGHVVLPLLREALGARIDAESFLAGYGLAQAMPGPLFTFASYLGALEKGALGALIATAAIFAPGFALYALALPLWSRICARSAARGAVSAANAAVMGILAATWLAQLLPSGLVSGRHLAISAGLLALAFAPRVPPVGLVVLGTGLGAALL